MRSPAPSWALVYSEAGHLSSTSEQQPPNQLPRATLRPLVAGWLRLALGDDPNVAAIAKTAGVSRTTIYAKAPAISAAIRFLEEQDVERTSAL